MWNDDEKGQRRPDIFEIATAYENGNGGIIRPRTNVWNSKKKTKELFDFFDNYGRNGIKINVNSESKDFYK